MIVLPCRDALLMLPAQINKWRFERQAIDIEETAPLSGSTTNNDDDDRLVIPDPPFIVHFLATLFIALTCFTAASFFPGVSTVWSICGSSLGFMIAYIIPSACYLRLRRRKGLNRRILAAWCMLIFSSFGCIICTIQALSRVMKPYAAVAEDFFDDDGGDDD